ncbi:MAG: hypothetical protein N4A59_05685 [Marinifilum sp.]|jgi:serine/threonine protein kinase|nr:hypothetical protein [Marinifilum sp.]
MENSKIFKVLRNEEIICIKKGSKVKQEIEIYSIVEPSIHIPEIIETYDDTLVREWLGDFTLNEIYPDQWNKFLVEDFYYFSKRIFEIFHSKGIFVKDFKSKNISYDGKLFYFFDLGGCTTLKKHDRVHLGSTYHVFRSFDSICGDNYFSNDYFAFANCLFDGLVGYPKWQNLESDPIKARESFQFQYEEYSKEFRFALENLNIEDKKVEFIIKCFCPFKEGRPGSFDWS